MAKDIHKEPFQESTIAKLAIFRDYLKEWLPVFLAPNTVYWNKINIFDFFAEMRLALVDLPLLL